MPSSDDDSGFFYKLREKLDRIYVQKDGIYNLMMTIVFGFCGLVLTTFVIGLIAAVFKVKTSL